MAKPTTADPIPPLLCPAEEAAAVDAEDFDADPKPLHRSLDALRADGEPAFDPDDRDPRAFASTGATELANTDWPPRWVTPAVAPFSRAARDEEGAATPGARAAPPPARLGARLPAPPRPALRSALPLAGRLEPLVDLLAPLVALETELEPLEADPLEEPADADVEGAGAGAAAGAGAEAGAGAAAGALPVPAGAGGGGAGSEPGVAGVPKPSPVHAQAMLATTTLAANTANTETETERVRPPTALTSSLN